LDPVQARHTGEAERLALSPDALIGPEIRGHTIAARESRGNGAGTPGRPGAPGLARRKWGIGILGRKGIAGTPFRGHRGGNTRRWRVKDRVFFFCFVTPERERARERRG